MSKLQFSVASASPFPFFSSTHRFHSKMKRKINYPPKQYSRSFKSQCLRVLRSQRRGSKVTPSIAMGERGRLYTPHYTTLSKWRRLERQGRLDVSPPPPRRQRLLTARQKSLLGGKVVDMRLKQKIVSLKSVHAWVLKEFGVDMSLMSVSRYLRSLHFSSRLISRKKHGYFDSGNASASYDFIMKARNFIKTSDIPLSEVVFMDVAKFSRESRHVSIYAPRGRFAPFCNISTELPVFKSSL